MTHTETPRGQAARGAMERDEQGGFITFDNRQIHHELQALRIRQRLNVSAAVARVIVAHAFENREATR